MRDVLRRYLFAVSAVGVQLIVALLWWLLTPAGLPGSFGGLFILSGVAIVVSGMSMAGGMDTALDNMHPGSNVTRMSEQGLDGDRRFLGGRGRWRGTKVVSIGMAYLAAGIGLWTLR